MNRNVFVTGADGFVGSHLVQKLVNEGYNVKALVYYNSWGTRGWLDDIPSSYIKDFEIIYGDVRDPEIINQNIKNIDYVFHLASLIAIPYSYTSPRSYIDTNIIGSHNVFNACLNSKKISKVIHISTSEVYGTAQYVPIDEKHPLVGQSPYSASKIAADKLAESYYMSFELPVITARPFNIFGPRQTGRAIIPTILSQICYNKTFVNLGTTSPTRDFNYITDTVKALTQFLDLENCFGETFNIGSGVECSIKEIVEKISKQLDVKIEIILDEKRIRPNQSEVNRLLADNRKLKEQINWKSEVNLEQGLYKTYEWINKNIHYFKKNIYNI
ncbi:GDP-mannose 4,6-dehydratase [Alphaproteobacteria bacterium]|nr:GDP-mannose 4,6-dehydratase [Alphaproteobacteria bacterium]